MRYFVKIYKFILLLILFIISIGIPENHLHSNRTLIYYLNNYKNITTLQANFIQKKYLTVMKSPQVSQGEFYFKKPDKVLWKMNKPYSYRFILNGNKVIKYYPQLNEREEIDLEENSQLKALFENIFLIMGLKSLDDISNNYFVSSNGSIIYLTPKKNNFKKYVKMIILRFSQHKLIQQIQIIEPSRDYTVIDFSNIRINQFINDSSFNN